VESELFPPKSPFLVDFGFLPNHLFASQKDSSRRDLRELEEWQFPLRSWVESDCASIHRKQLRRRPPEVIFWRFMDLKSASSTKMESGMHISSGNRSHSIHCVQVILSCTPCKQLTRLC
jgi:hypothetical protein